VSAELEQEPAELDRLAQRWLAAWTGGGSFTSCSTGDISYEDPLLRVPLTGIDAVETHSAQLREAFPDMSAEPTAPTLFRGELACFAWQLSGTHRGDIAFVPATDRQVCVHGLHYVELSDGLVRRARGFIDLYEAAVQLGLLPESGGYGQAAMMLLRGFGLRL